MKKITSRKIKRKKPADKITKRGKEILILFCEEYTNQEVAEQLGLSKRTIENHRMRLLKTTESKNLAGLVKFAHRSGIYKIPRK